MQQRQKSSPKRPCERCEDDAPRLYRVRLSGTPWRLVCRACWAAAFEGRPGYQYGGTWTGRDRGR